MNVELQMADEFGEFCANGELAAQVRFERIEPLASAAAQIVFDFKGVRNMNSSFCNALIANLIRQHPDVVPKLRFINCRPNVRVLIKSAVDLGIASVGSNEHAK